MPQPPSPLPDDSRPPGISLEALTAAFAEAMGAGPAPPAQPPAASDEATVEGAADFETTAPQGEDEQWPEDATGTEEEAWDDEAPPKSQPADAPDDDLCELSPKTILEAMLFVGSRDGEPLSAARAAELMRDVEPEEIAALVDELNDRYTADGCPYHVVHEGSGYRLALRKEFHPLRNRFYGRVREARLSQAAIDVLALVAYQQPLSGDQVSRLRGKPSSHVLSQMVRRGLLRIERRAAEPGKRKVAEYFTTDRFLELFGMADIRELPQSEELDRQ